MRTITDDDGNTRHEKREYDGEHGMRIVSDAGWCEEQDDATRVSDSFRREVLRLQRRRRQRSGPLLPNDAAWRWRAARRRRDRRAPNLRLDSCLGTAATKVNERASSGRLTATELIGERDSRILQETDRSCHHVNQTNNLCSSLRLRVC